MRTVAFCEIDPFCQRVLAKHWPGVPCYDDARTLTAARLAADGIVRSVGNANSTSADAHAAAGPPWQAVGKPSGSIDVICGGFPCQDISTAGKGAGIGGARSGLWSEYARIIGEVRPRFVLVENVAALLGRGLERVLGDLASLGYDAEWHCIPASAVGAPHRRDRVWIVADAISLAGRSCGTGVAEKGARGWDTGGGGSSQEPVADADSGRQPQQPQCNSEPLSGQQPPQRDDAFGLHNDVSDATGEGQSQPVRTSAPLLSRKALELAGSECSGRDHWLIEPGMGRVAHGVPARVDRLKALGNAVVPQIPELIGRAIMATKPNKQQRE